MAKLLDSKEFEYKGYVFSIKRIGYDQETFSRMLNIGMNEFPYWRCGYVCIPKDHPNYEVHYDDLYNTEKDIECHGGLTYSQKGKDGGWWVGFDCNHYDDTPYDCDESYVKSECESIVEQLIKIKEKLND